MPLLYRTFIRTIKSSVTLNAKAGHDPCWPTHGTQTWWPTHPPSDIRHSVTLLRILWNADRKTKFIIKLFSHSNISLGTNDKV